MNWLALRIVIHVGRLSTKMAVHKIMAVTGALLQRLQRQKTQQLSSDSNSVKHSVSPSLYNLLWSSNWLVETAHMEMAA